MRTKKKIMKKEKNSGTGHPQKSVCDDEYTHAAQSESHLAVNVIERLLGICNELECGTCACFLFLIFMFKNRLPYFKTHFDFLFNIKINFKKRKSAAIFFIRVSFTQKLHQI